MGWANPRPAISGTMICTVQPGPRKAGTTWLRDHADQLAHLRVLRANQQWESLWN